MIRRKYCVSRGPKIVGLGARCPQPSSRWSSPLKSCFGRHPSQYLSDTSQSFFSKPLHFGVPASLVNLLFENTSNILDRMKLRDSKRVHLYGIGAQNGCFCPILSALLLLPLFQLLSKLRATDSLVCPNNSLPHSSSRKGPLSIHFCSQFH